MFDQTTGRSRCFGFLSFQDPTVVDTVLSKIHVLDKKQIDPKRASQRHQTNGNTTNQRQKNQSPPSKVFIGGIHMDATEEIISSALSESFGDVLDISLMRDRETGRFRGFGFVSFKEHRSALLACSQGHITILGRRADIKEATRRQPGESMSPISASSYPPTSTTNKRSPPVSFAPPNDSLSPEQQLKQEEAWKEYYEKNPEYYDQMIKIYSDPALLKEYLVQYYADSNMSTENIQKQPQKECEKINVHNNYDRNVYHPRHHRDDDDDHRRRRDFSSNHYNRDSRYNNVSRYRNDHHDRYNVSRNTRYSDSRNNNDSRREDRYRSLRSRSVSPPPPPPTNGVRVVRD